MGLSQSKQESNILIHQVSPRYKQKVDPLLRANHKHSILLDTTPTRVSEISQILASASILELRPSSRLFDLWDTISHETIDVTDSHEEIVESDYLSPESLGHESHATRYVDFFDDEIVRYLYRFDQCAQQYLNQDEVVDGLMARDGWAARQLACALELNSQEMCAEALGGALSFYVPLSNQDLSPNTTTTSSETYDTPRTLNQVCESRDGWIDTVLETAQVTRPVLNHLVVLRAIATLWTLLPDVQFKRLWTHQTRVLRHLASTTETITTHHHPVSGDDTEGWNKLIDKVATDTPVDLIGLRLLKAYPKHGLSIARKLFDV